MEELARRVGCSISLAARAVSEAGLKEPTYKETILRNHIDANGKLHIDGKPASQRAVAKYLGCDTMTVNRAVQINSTSGKSLHPSPKLHNAQKAYQALTDPEKCRFLEWLGDRVAYL